MLKNLTPHTITLIKPDGSTIDILSSGMARASERREIIEIMDDGFVIDAVSYGGVSGLPESDGETIYIVSALVRMAVPDRHDVVSPGVVVRDADGKVIGCKSLTANQ